MNESNSKSYNQVIYGLRGFRKKTETPALALHFNMIDTDDICFD